jgi:CheY-like chemotaxis protein
MRVTPAALHQVVRVVVADDNAHHRTLLTEFLEAEGFLVVQAHDGAELLEILSGVRPGYFAAVICDQVMPGMLGTECLARASSRARFVIVSSSSDPQVEEAARKLGAAGFLRKPFDIATLGDLLGVLTAEGGPSTGVRSTRA